MKLSTISDIIHNPHRQVRTPDKYNTYTLPFVNCRHRARVRVVDVFPPELIHFAHSTRDKKWNKHPKKQSSTGDVAREKWEWGFVLLLEDANVPRDTVSEKLRVIVNNEAAQCLLKMNAVE
jgi:protection-of-telomeres protein 1